MPAAQRNEERPGKCGDACEEEAPAGLSKDKIHNNTYEERLGVGVVRKDPRTDFLDTVGAAAWKRNIGPGVDERSGGGAAPYSYEGRASSPTFAAALRGESSRTVGHFAVEDC